MVAECLLAAHLFRRQQFLRLSFNTSRRYARDECFLGEEEEEEDGEDDQDAGGHEEVPGGAAELGLVALEAQGQRELFGAVDVDERAEEVVPGGHEDEEGDDGEGGAGEGEDDAPEDAQFGAAVDAGGFGEFFGDGHEELAEEEDGEGGAEPGGEPEGFEGAVELDGGVVAEPAVEGKEGGHGDGEGDHHGGEHEAKEKAAAAEADPGEAVRDDGTGDRGAQDGEGGDDEGVARPEEEVVLDGFGIVVAGLAVAFGGEGAGQNLRRVFHRVFGGLDAGGEHPEKGEQGDGADEQEQEMDAPAGFGA